MNRPRAYDPVESHIRAYRTLLKTKGFVKIGDLSTSHQKMKPVLHEKANSASLDIAAFIYVLLRLPSSISHIHTIVLGQSHHVFETHGFADIKYWKEVESPGRRRKTYHDGAGTLAVFIASVSDVDDIVTILTAFQMEWNSLHARLKGSKNPIETAKKILPEKDRERLMQILNSAYDSFLQAVKTRRVDFTVRLLTGSYVEYAKATNAWLETILTTLSHLDIPSRPIYFVSSNTHSLTNILTRFVLLDEKRLIQLLYKSKNETLITIWENIKSGDTLVNRENFLYYLAKKYAPSNPDILRNKKERERALGIHTVASSHYLDIDVQVVELQRLAGVKLDERLEINTTHLSRSQALIVNIDYPLGWAAYEVLAAFAYRIDIIRGIYIMGKAATLSGNIGDILIPHCVFDQHTKNVYSIRNTVSSSDFKKLFRSGKVYDRQKTVVCKGTFLQNHEYLGEWYKGGYTIVEMETGPYLNAAYEFVNFNRYVENQTLDLTNTPFEIGIAHYASDTPYSKARNLGIRNLSYEGVEPTYAISLVILKKIIEREKLVISDKL